MMRAAINLGLAILISSVLSTNALALASPDLILRNGHILTGQRGQPSVEAIAITRGRIEAIGTNVQIDALARDDTRVVELDGRTVIAGVNDAHDHVGDVPFGPTAVTPTPAMRNPPLSEVVEAIRSAAATAPADAWIHSVVGVAVMAEPAATRAGIDAVAGGRPVVLSAWWGHGVLLNAEGLRRLGIGPQSRNPPGGEYERDADGRLTGKLLEYAGWTVLQRLHSMASIPATEAYLQAYAQRRLAEGVTTVRVMAGYQRPDIFSAAVAAAALPMRIRIVAFPMPGEVVEDGHGPVNPLVTASGVKWVLDGTPIEQLAFRSTAYEGRPEWYGRPNFAEGELRTILSSALDTGKPLLLHVVGDAMLEQVLSQMEALAPAAQWRPLRVRIEHANGLAGARLSRAAALGLVVAQPRPTSPIASWIKAGIPVAYGSDSGFPPFAAFAQMVDPTNPNGVDRDTALAILTSGGAFAEFAEGDRGILDVGMQADLAVLSQDIMTVPGAALPATRSLMTIVAGQVAFEAPGFSSDP